MAFSFCLGAPPSPSAGRPPFGLQNEANLLPPVTSGRPTQSQPSIRAGGGLRLAPSPVGRKIMICLETIGVGQKIDTA